MALVEREIPGIGLVTLQKRRGTRSMRIHIQGSKVKVTLPWHMPYRVAEQFAMSKKGWIRANLSEKSLLVHGNTIGKRHRITVLASSGNSARTSVKEGEIRLFLPKNIATESAKTQDILKRACEKALAVETTEDIIPRLTDIAFEHDFMFKSVRVKKLKSRWGSCDSQKNITLNSYLAQLPWKLVDYVLVHELAHTKHLNHSSAFWEEVSAVLPNYKELRKETKTYSPHDIKVYP